MAPLSIKLMTTLWIPELMFRWLMGIASDSIMYVSFMGMRLSSERFIRYSVEPAAIKR